MLLCSIRAGRQLSYVQYQLYTKQKGLNYSSVCARGKQDPSSIHEPSKPSLNHLQSDSIKPQPSHTQTLSTEVLKSTYANHKANFTERSNHQLDVRLWVCFINRAHVTVKCCMCLKERKHSTALRSEIWLLTQQNNFICL